MLDTNRPPRFLAIVAAIALLAIGTIALAHEIEHDLGNHDEPSCPLHLYVSNVGAAAGEAGHVPVADLATPDPAAAIATPQTALRLGYRGRAPPRAIALLS